MGLGLGEPQMAIRSRKYVHGLTLTGKYSQKSAELDEACTQSTALGEGAEPSLRREETAV